MTILAYLISKIKPRRKMTVAEILSANLKAGRLVYIWDIPFQGEPVHADGQGWGGNADLGLEARYQ